MGPLYSNNQGSPLRRLPTPAGTGDSSGIRTADLLVYRRTPYRLRHQSNAMHGWFFHRESYISSVFWCLNVSMVWHRVISLDTAFQLLHCWVEGIYDRHQMDNYRCRSEKPKQLEDVAYLCPVLWHGTPSVRTFMTIQCRLKPSKNIWKLFFLLTNDLFLPEQFL